MNYISCIIGWSVVAKLNEKKMVKLREGAWVQEHSTDENLRNFHDTWVRHWSNVLKCFPFFKMVSWYDIPKYLYQTILIWWSLNFRITDIKYSINDFGQKLILFDSNHSKRGAHNLHPVLIGPELRNLREKWLMQIIFISRAR